eukprot:TRINITY_DN1718_c0_g3_i1.p1 TRINITY_DN1718_c0_g3~~TRINITY_DN1718_c0_g3_i1.p1  ORF type:complete len:519 (-),score=113.72 TRINITY_DN1718_c0_g3_i1:148-1704(-)
MSHYAQNRQASRMREFKKSIEVLDARKKREETALKIRKEKRIESFQKRRNIEAQTDESLETSLGEDLQNLIALVRSDNVMEQIEGTTKIRKQLSIENNPPIQDVIDAGLVPVLMNFLRRTDLPPLQFEAAWALTNIASGSSQQTKVVIEAGAVPLFKELLSSTSDDVREQAVWALGNIAGDSPICRDYVLSQGVLEILLLNIEQSHKLAMLRNTTWALSNLCRGKPQPKWDLVSPALPILSRLLYSTDDEVLTDACWALSYLSDGPNERIQAVVDLGVARKLVEILRHPLVTVQTPVLRTLGNLVTGDDPQTQSVLNVGILSTLQALLTCSKRSILKEVCWTLSNITAGNRSQIQSVIEANLIPDLVRLVASADFDVRREAAWALSNATSGGSSKQIKYLVECNLIPPMCDLLHSSDVRIVLIALECLENLLKVGEKDKAKQVSGINVYADKIEECEGLDKLDNLQNHVNSEVYDKVVQILETYYAAEEDDENTAPNVNTKDGSFAFGMGGSGTGFSF